MLKRSGVFKHLSARVTTEQYKELCDLRTIIEKQLGFGVSWGEMLLKIATDYKKNLQNVK